MLKTILRAHPFYSVFTALSSCTIIIRGLQIHLPSLLTRPLDFGLAAGWGVGGGGGMMTTVLRKHNQQYHHKSRFTRYLQYFRDVLLSYIVATPTSGLCVLNFAVSNEKPKKLEIRWGNRFPRYLQYLFWRPRFYSVFTVLSHTTPKLFSGMITTLFRGHPEQYLHTLAHTPHSTSNANPPTPRAGL